LAKKGDNEIDNEGIKLISLANWPNLKYLYLKGNKMMNPPIKVLLNSYWPEISVLDIGKLYLI
jgi:Leucine-rich repeat (LRR) protein